MNSSTGVGGCTRPFVLALLIATLSGWGGAARALAAVDLASTDFAPRALAGHFEILLDAGGLMTLDEVIAAPAGRFALATADDRNLGFTQARVWVRFALAFDESMHKPVVLVLPKPLIDHVELFSLRPDGTRERIVTGDAHRHDSRPLDYRAFAFELAPAPGQVVTYYLHVVSPTSAIELPLTVMTSAGFSVMLATENFLFGGYFGVMAALVVSTLLLFALMRIAIFAWYSLYLTAFTLAMAALNGYGMQFLWPLAPGAQQLLPIAFSALSIMTGIVFVRRFLSAPERWPGGDRYFIAAALASAAGLVLHLAMPGPLGMQVVLGVAIALCPLVLVLCGRGIVAGDRVARYFLFGWMAYVVGVIAAALDMLGWIPHSALSAYALYGGSLAEFLTLSIALADHLHSMQRDKERQIAEVNADLAELNVNLERIVHHRTLALEERNRELRELAVRDSLTGLYNHSTTIELLEQLLQQSQRYEFSLAAIMVDLDHFKQLNDNHGHQVGDQVLEAVSQALLESVRGADVVGRYGGEEFLIAMPHADAHAAREYGERLLRRMREIDVLDGTYKLTASIGISVFHSHGQRISAPELVRRADEALYRSKRDGRDCITVDSLSLVAGDADQIGQPAAPA